MKQEIRLASDVAKTRECGRCTACCTFLAIEEFKKDRNRTCCHASGNGCSIYDRRPNECRDYLCLWRQGHLENDCRPDNCGVMFHIEERPNDPGVKYFYAFETWLGSFRSKEAKRLLNGVAGIGVLVLIQNDTVTKVWCPSGASPVTIAYAKECVDRWNISRNMYAKSGQPPSGA